MSAPDQHMPMFWPEFWLAVEGHPDVVTVGYLRALSFYWHHEHCEGLRNDDEYLRKICRIDRECWPEAKAVIFDNDRFFVMDVDGLWRQKRADEEWSKAVNNYKTCVKRAHAGAKARWKKH